MARHYAIYKGLQKPLVYRGFKGKFIFWGVGALLAGLVLGGLTIALVNMWLGALVLIGCIVGGLLYIADKQKKGLHSKAGDKAIYIHPSIQFETPEPLWPNKHLNYPMPASITACLSVQTARFL